MDASTDTRFVIGPNASLSVRGAWWFFGLTSGLTLSFAFAATFFGFWPILPFAGLELVALGAALVVSMHRNRYREVISFTGDKVTVEFGLAGEGARARVELPRGWARAWIEPGSTGNEPTHLVLGCSGRRIEIGRCLTDAEREQLVKRFKSHLRPTAHQAVPAAREAEATLGDR